MGLDIVYGKVINKIEGPPGPDFPEEFIGLNIIKAQVPEFALTSLDGLEQDAYYEVKYLDDGVRFGSYSSFGLFRELLGEAVGVKNEEISLKMKGIHKDMPFFELLYFSDCEGVFGPKAIRRLYDDFDEMRPKVVNFINRCAANKKEREWFLERYDMFYSILRKTKDDGFILFC